MSASSKIKKASTSLVCVSAHAGCEIKPGGKFASPMPEFFKVDKLTCVINGAPFGWSVQVHTNPDIDPSVAPEKMAKSWHDYNDTEKIIKIINETLRKLEFLILDRIPKKSGMNTLLDFLNDDELIMFTEILRQQILKHCDIEIQQLEKGKIQDPNKKLNLQIFWPGDNMLSRMYDLEDLGGAFGSIIIFHKDKIVLDKPSGIDTRLTPQKHSISNQEIFASIMDPPPERLLYCDFGCWGLDMELTSRGERQNISHITKYLEEVDIRTQSILESVIAENVSKFREWQAALEYQPRKRKLSTGGNRKTRKQRKNKRNKKNKTNRKNKRSRK